MKSKKKYIAITIVVILVIIVISVISLYLYKTSPSYKIKTMLKEEIGYLKKKVVNLNSSTFSSLLNSTNTDKKKSVTTNKPLNVNTDLRFDLDITKELDKTKNSKILSIENLLNNADINFSTSIDNQNKYVESKINYKYDKEKFNANLYIQDNNVYIYAKDFLDSYITVLDENSEAKENYIIKLLDSGMTLNDVVSLLNLLNNTVDKIKISDKIISTKELVSIGNVSKETKKDTLVIDNELLSRFSAQLLANAINSSKALSIIQKIDGSENVSDTKEKLVKMYNQVKARKVEFLEENKYVKMSIYMQGFIPEFLKQEIQYDITDNINGEFSFLKYNVDNYSRHFVLEQGNNNYALNTLEQSGNKYNLQLVIKQNNNVKYIAEVSGVISAKKVDVTYNLKSLDLNIVNGKVKYSQTFEKKKKNSNLVVEFNAENIDYGKGKIEVSSEIKGVNNVKKQEIKNDIKISELDENSKNLIKVKMLKKLPSIYGLIK